MNIKEIMEKRGAKFKELDALRTKSNRSADDNTRFDALALEIEGLDQEHSREVRALALSSSKPIETSAKEDRDLAQFDLGRALRGVAAQKFGRGEALVGIEAEMAQEGAKEAREGGMTDWSGIMLPRVVARRQDRSGVREGRAMSATGTTTTSLDQGGQTIASIPAGLMDAFFDAIVLEKAGFTILEGLTGNLPLPRIVAGTASAFKAENAAADATSPTVSTPTLTPHRLSTYTDIGEQLLMQSTSNIQAVVRNLLIAQVAQQFQQACINGAGSGVLIKGLLNVSGLGAAYAGGAATNGTNANGAALVWDDPVNLETVVGSANVPLTDRMVYLTNAKVRGAGKKTKKGGGSSADSTMIWNGGFNEYPTFITNSVPSTLTKGTLTTGSALIYGHAPDAFVGFWSGLNLDLIRDATLATIGQYRLIGAVYGDFQLPRPEAFAAIKDLAA
jgi:HK97 family phage major capsid protein